MAALNIAVLARGTLVAPLEEVDNGGAQGNVRRR